MRTMEMKSPEEILYLFDTKKIDNDWSFVEYKPSDTTKWTHGYYNVERIITFSFDLVKTYHLTHPNNGENYKC